jgi:hypothetical protein
VTDPFSYNNGGKDNITRPIRQLQGASVFNYYSRTINHRDTLLGNRYLCRCGGLFIVAPSGHGKSVLALQAAIQLACGQATFGIRTPNGPLKSLIVQSEDDEGDLIEMAQIIDHLQLSPEQRKLVEQNTHIEFVNDQTGADFLDTCDGFLSQWAADLLWINPYTAYLGADIKDDAANTRFLRNGLNPILTKYRCGVIPIHHTPKTNLRDTTDWKASDWMYSGAGAAVLTNWARAYLVIDPCETPGVYKFIAAKRGKRIGWGNHVPVYEQFWAHSRTEDQLLWLPADSDQIALAKPAGKKTPEDLLTLIPLLDPAPMGQIQFEANQKWGLGMNKVRDFINVLVHQGKAFKHQFPRPRTSPETKYARTPPTRDTPVP